MRIAPTNYVQTDEDLQYLADLNNDYPEIPTLPDGGPAPKVNEHLGLEQPNEQPEPEPVAAPHAEPDREPDADADDSPPPVQTPAPAAQPAEKPQESWYQPLVAKELARTEGNQSKLVSKAPNWFDFAAPPEITGNEAAIMSVVSGLIQAGLAPDKKSAIAMALGGVADAANAKLAAPQQDYQNKLKAAGSQAQMAATLRSGGGNALGAANLDLQWQKYLHQLETEKGKAEADRQLKDPNSEISKQIRQAFVAGGIFKPEAAEKLSGWQLQQGRVGAQQQAGAERTLGNQKLMNNVRYKQWAEKFEMANNEDDRRHARNEMDKIESEEREQTKSNEQAYIPGWMLASKRAPSTHAVDEARKLSAASEQGIQAAAKLGELRDKLSDMRLTGKLYEWLSTDPEAKQAFSDAKIWQKTLMDSQREISGLGVLQGFEKAMTEETNPNVGSLDEFFNGSFDYNGYARILPQRAAARMKAYGFTPDAEDAPEAPAPAKARSVHDAVKGSQKAGKELLPQAIDAGKQVVKGAVNTAGQVAGAAADVAAPAAAAANKVMVRIKGSDKWQPAPATKAALDKLKEKWGDKLEIQGQVNAR